MARTNHRSSRKNALLKRSISADQVLTGELPAEARKGLSKQCVAPNPATGGEGPLHNTVKHGPLIPKHERAKGGRKRKPGRKPAKRRGGWPETRYLDHDEFKQAKSDANMICNAGYRWSIFVSLMPPDYLSDAGKQKWIRQRLGWLGQALERRGQPYVSQTTLEKKRGGNLHGHALIFVLPENFDVIERHADKFLRVARKKLDGEISVEFHAEVIDASPDDLRNIILYSLKQHLFAGEFEKSRKFWMRAGDPIKGSRLSYSKMALAILAREKAKLPSAADNAPAVAAAAPTGDTDNTVQKQIEALPATTSPPIASPIKNGQQPIAAPMQLGLFADLPLRSKPPKPQPARAPVAGPVSHPSLPIEAQLIDLAARAEAIRIASGETQEHFADKHLGLSQGGYSNWQRDHDKLGQWRINRLIEFIRLAA